MTLLLVFAALAFLLFVRLPIAFAIGIAACLYMWIAGVPLIILAQQIANGPDSWVLLAMPLFILAGLLMNDVGISQRLIAFTRALVGTFRGALGQANVVTNMIFGGVSGSAVADAAAIGSILIPAMEKEGYPKSFTAALTSSAGSIGIIIPPSIPMILYASIAGVSVGTLFIAGIIPGVLVGLCQMVVVYVVARRNRWGTTEAFSLGRIVTTGRGAILALMMPVIIIGGILGGVFTPTEAGGVAAVYAILLGLFVYRSLTWASLYRTLVRTGVLTAVVMIIVATSYTLSWVLSFEQVPAAITTWFTQISRTPTVVLVLFLILLIILGMFLHGDPIMLIVVPMLLPTIRALNIDLIQFGIIVTFTIAIGQQTPPVGSTLFVVSALSGEDIMAITRKNMPFIILFVLLTVGMIMFPQITLFLPRLFRMM